LVVLNDVNAIFSGNPLEGLVTGGAVVMQSTYENPADVWQRIPLEKRRILIEKQAHVHYIDMVKIARQVASEADLEMRMQGIVLLGCFLKLTPYTKASGMTDAHVFEGVETALRKYFGKRGDRVVQDNLMCVKQGYQDMKEVPREIMVVQEAMAVA
jgi:pyruvate-ferredoxin/flavodoxin oxidoreductase